MKLALRLGSQLDLILFLIHVLGTQLANIVNGSLIPPSFVLHICDRKNTEPRGGKSMLSATLRTRGASK